MELKTRYITKKYKRNFLIIAIYALIASLLGFWFGIGGYYTLLFTAFILLFSLFGVCTCVFYTYSTKITSLKVSDAGLLFIYPFGYKMAYWKDIKHIELSDSSLRLIFNRVQGKDNFFTKIVFRANEIPIHLFIEKWQDSNTWLIDPLLILVEKVFNANERP